MLNWAQRKILSVYLKRKAHKEVDKIMDKILNAIFSNKRNWGMVMIGLSYVVEGAEFVLQPLIPTIPLQTIVQGLRAAGGTWMGVGGADAIRKNK